MDAPVRIENRSQLIYLLTEAAELEHGVMCCYLFAAFSIKRDMKEGVTEEQLDVMRRWRGTILQIAIQEMVHMSLACNLLTAVGGAPHLHRPNLPTSPRAYPASFRLELIPFCRETLENFVFIERPEDQERADSGATSPGEFFLPEAKLSDIFSSERQYQTVGHLYRGIEDGLRYLTEKFGEEQLFIGPPNSQIADAYFSLPGLLPVTDLESAVTAIQGIVEQGEGARDDNEESHYRRFLAMLEEYDRILSDAPDFEPGRPVMENPYAMFPNDIGDHSALNLIEDTLSMDICNLFDGCYQLVMQMLGRVLLHTEESEEQLTLLSDITVNLMIDVLGPLGTTLTTMPAGASHPGLTAGPSFRLSRDVRSLPHQAAAWALFTERLRELSAYCGFLQAEGDVSGVLTRVRGSLDQYAEQLTQ
ncbi:MAG: ferritin-like protein [Chloroflexi bacterium]|nr:ferritin-like protein [Chloroflexota bacterium]